MMWNPLAALDRWLTRGMADYELRATAEQFAVHWRFPYGGVMIQSAVCIWLMWPYITPGWIGLWFALSALSWAARACFLAPLKTGFDSLPNCRRVLSIITLSSMSIGMSWGSFVLVYFDAQDPVRILTAGVVVAGNVGAGGPILGTFLPSFYAMAVPASAPLLLHLLLSEQTELRVLTNFVSNSFKHTEGGCVYVGTRLRAGYSVGQRLCIEVRDSGTGIEAHQIPLLFDAYRGFDDRRASESHGLGLAIAKAQGTYLGCDIDVRSQPGRGSTYTLCGLRTA